LRLAWKNAFRHRLEKVNVGPVRQATTMRPTQIAPARRSNIIARPRSDRMTLLSLNYVTISMSLQRLLLSLCVLQLMQKSRG